MDEPAVSNAGRIQCPACGSLLEVRVLDESDGNGVRVRNACEPGEKHLLTPRDREVLRLMALGARDRDIAVACGISVDGAKRAVRSLLIRLAAQNRTEAACRAVAGGLVDLTSLEDRSKERSKELPDRSFAP